MFPPQDSPLLVIILVSRHYISLYLTNPPWRASTISFPQDTIIPQVMNQPAGGIQESDDRNYLVPNISSTPNVISMLRSVQGDFSPPIPFPLTPVFLLERFACPLPLHELRA